MKKVISLIAIVMVFVFSVNICFADTAVTTPAPTTEAKHPMKDLDINSDLGKSVLKLYEAGVINGYEESDGTYTYRPDKTITRAEFCKMVNTTFGYTVMADNKFSDVNPDKWYYIYVLSAIHYGYIQGFEDNTFRGEGNITREQACVILDRILKKKAETKPVIADDVSSWAKDAVENITGLGYMPIEEGGKFRAKENLTRAEFALALDDFATAKAPEDSKGEQNQQTQGGQQTQQTPKPNKPSGGSSGGEKDSNEGADIGGSNSGNTSGENTSGGDDSGDIGGKEESYTITYNKDGGSLSGAKTSYKASDSDYTLPAPSRSGYKFMGWFENKDADPASADPVTILASGSTGNKTYYAKWGKNYTIKYVLHPAEYEKEEDPTILGVLDGTQKTSYCQYDDEYVLPIPTRGDGEEFVGWYEAQTFRDVKNTIIMTDEYKAETIPTGTEGNKTYYAVWQDMVGDAEDTYYYVNDAILAISDIKDLMPLAIESGVLTFFENALPEVSSWEAQGVLVTKKLVRAIYESEADIIRGTYLELQAAGRDQELKDELLQLRGIENLVTIFGVNIAFGTGDIEVLE